MNNKDIEYKTILYILNYIKKDITISDSTDICINTIVEQVYNECWKYSDVSRKYLRRYYDNNITSILDKIDGRAKTTSTYDYYDSCTLTDINEVNREKVDFIHIEYNKSDLDNILCSINERIDYINSKYKVDKNEKQGNTNN